MSTSGNASSGAGALPFGFAFALCDFALGFAVALFPAPFGFAYGVNAEDAEVLAGPYLGGGPVGCNGEIDLGLLRRCGILGWWWSGICGALRQC